MANNLRIQSVPNGYYYDVPYYYTQMTARELKYHEYLERVAAVMDVTESIEENTNKQIAVNAVLAERIQSSIVDAHVASAKALYNNFQVTNRILMGGFAGVAEQLQSGFSGLSNQVQAGFSDVSEKLQSGFSAVSSKLQWGFFDLSNQMQGGFSHLSREIGYMHADMNLGFAMLSDTVQESSKVICERLDAINNILNNPSLTKSRELYRRSVTEYTKGFYEEALADLLEAIKIHRTDAVSWFLLGKTYLFGRGAFSDVGETVDVIDLDAAITAFRNAAKYIQPDVKPLEEGRLLAAEIRFYLGLAQQTKSGDMTFSKDSAASQDYIRQALGSFAQSWKYSEEMLESLYNHARCQVFLGDIDGSLYDLERVILKDRWYCVKTAADPDFDAITEKFHDLLQGMKRDLYSEAKADFDQIQKFKVQLQGSSSSELVRLLEAMPDSDTENMPYFDMREVKESFPKIKELWEEECLFQKGFVRIVGGTFMMGSPADPAIYKAGFFSWSTRNDDECPQHQVKVSSFYMGKYEVTQREYQAIMGKNPSHFKGDNLPVEQVSWYDAVEYCNKRSQRAGLTPAYTITGEMVSWNRSANGYRLPTEAEWEYACRAGTTGPFNTGNNITTSQANYNGNYINDNDPTHVKGIYREKTTEVGSFAPNPWGLYDMHGNVEEWCWDWYGDYSSGTQTDPDGAVSGIYRVKRGGSWRDLDSTLYHNISVYLHGQGWEQRSAHRGSGTPSDRYFNLGFRVLRL